MYFVRSNPALIIVIDLNGDLVILIQSIQFCFKLKCLICWHLLMKNYWLKAARAKFRTKKSSRNIMNTRGRIKWNRTIEEKWGKEEMRKIIKRILKTIKWIYTKSEMKWIELNYIIINRAKLIWTELNWADPIWIKYWLILFLNENSIFIILPNCSLFVL